MLTPKAARAREIDLGLAVSGALLKPGETRTLREIAAFCGCHWNNIIEIEQNALKKLRHPSRLKHLSLEDLKSNL